MYRERLMELADSGYAKLQRKILPGVAPETVIGVRVPQLRKLAAEISKTEDGWEFMNTLPHKYYDENNLHAFLIEKINDYDVCMEYLEHFLPYVDNWATCDGMSPKVFAKHKKELLKKIRVWIKSDKTYTVRFAIRMLMNHFLEEDFDPKYLKMVASVKSEEYYVNMMRAWYFATALSKQWDATVMLLENRALDVWTHNKTIQKAVESFRITKVQKRYLRGCRIDKEVIAADKVRNQWATGDAARDKGLTPPENVRELTNICYAPEYPEMNLRWHLMDIYYPTDVIAAEYPVIVSVHGGGWFYGDKELYKPYCQMLSSLGFAVVNFNYRRGPEYKYPATFNDVCLLMDHISEKACEYRLDLSRLYMLGDSAGAQLTSQYGIYSTSADYRRLCGFGESLAAPVPKRLALNCGVYNTRNMYSNRDEIHSWYFSKKIAGDTLKSFTDLMDFMNSEFPESYVMASANDPLKVETPFILEKLRENGVKHIYREFGEDNPGDGHVFHVNLRSENGKKCNAEEIEFFNKGL